VQTAIVFDSASQPATAHDAAATPLFMGPQRWAEAPGSRPLEVTAPTPSLPVAPVVEAAAGATPRPARPQNLLRGMDDVRRQVEKSTEFNQTVVGSSLMASTGLSVGYILWLCAVACC
jgi:hypothetical protein